MSRDTFFDYVIPEPKPEPSKAFCTDRDPRTDPLMHRTATSTERSAAAKVKPVRATMRGRVLCYFRAAGPLGLTPPEAAALEAAHRQERPSARIEYSVRPRITELRRAGYLTAAGGERGGSAVYIATAKSGEGEECSGKRAKLPPRIMELGDGGGMIAERIDGKRRALVFVPAALAVCAIGGEFEIGGVLFMAREAIEGARG